MILYWPSPSVTTVRTFSMRAGLAASTVTPGKTAPVASRTTPAMAPVVADCADVPAGASSKPAKMRNTAMVRSTLMSFLPGTYTRTPQRPLGTPRAVCESGNGPTVLPAFNSSQCVSWRAVTEQHRCSKRLDLNRADRKVTGDEDDRGAAPIEAAPRWPLTPPFAPAVSHLAGPSPVSAARDTRHNWKPVTADQSRPRKIGSAGCPSWYSTDVSGGRLRPPELLEMAAAMLLVSTGAVGDGTRHVAHVVLGVATLTFAVAGRLRHVSRVVYGVSAPV